MVITIHIPDGAHCLLKENQKVNFGDPYIEKRSESKIDVPVAKKLDIEPSKIFHYLKKLVGEKVKKGETLAVKKGLFSTAKIKSEHDGVIQEINHNDGIVRITIAEGDKRTIDATFKGKVREISDGEIKIEVDDSEEYRISNATSDYGGGTYFIGGEAPDLKSGDIHGKVVISESISEFNQIKAEALGAIGFVTQIKIDKKNSDVGYAQLKSVGDMEKITRKKFPYCLIDKKNSRIVFYK
ncbi:MAG: hypothetical protein ACOYUB_01495 [Patescibacteria group bacterium]